MAKEDTGGSSAEAPPAESEVSVGRGPRVAPQRGRPFNAGGGEGRGGGREGGGPSGGGPTSETSSEEIPRRSDGNESVKDIKSRQRKLLNDPRFHIRPMQQVLSACAGAMITACFMTPLDVIKTRMQSQQSPSHKCFFYSNGLMDHLFAGGSDGAAMGSLRPRPQFTSTWDALLKISRYEGIGALWSGLGPTLVSALPSTIIYFVAYEQFKAKYLQLYERHANGNGAVHLIGKSIFHPQGHENGSAAGGSHDVGGHGSHLCGNSGESH
ncbi:uncharacterized protein LOC108096140 isoform X2 [Drosophila ficusphila]|uniref:uncharacterized protein LOC108096140 isoform X2 n=1 Tax=Drosophila ficusphila TaxID=30025 RepID=UPI0007E5C3C9|nr:uncharacterized protein LOC108096140 isoform X2 [Drosophila ficusphila]